LVVRRAAVLVLVTLLLLALVLAGCSLSAPADTSCRSHDRPGFISCREARLIADAVARSHGFQAGRIQASVRREGVAEGRSVPAWFVVAHRALYRSGSGSRCLVPEYTVVVAAASGRLLAWDEPSLARCANVR